MTTLGPQLSINQFAQQAVPGQLDLQISKSGVIAGVVSPNQATPLIAGQSVKIDATVSTPGLPNFVASAVTDAAPVSFGKIVYTVKAATFNAGDPIEVTFLGGPVMFCVADSSINAGDQVDDASTVPNVETHGTNVGSKSRGVAIDPAAAGQFTRVILMNPAV